MKLIKWVSVIALSISPIFCTEKTNIAEITDPFFVNGTTSSGSKDVPFLWVSEITEKSGTVRVTVCGQLNNDTKEIVIEPTCKVIKTVEDDDTKTYTQVVEASVKCGETIFTEELTLKEPHPYPAQERSIYYRDGKSVTEFDLQLGATYQEGKETISTKPSNGQEFKKRQPPSHDITVCGLHNDQPITSFEDFLGLGVPCINVHKTTLGSGDHGITTTKDPVVYQLVLHTNVSPSGAFYKCIDHNFEEKSNNPLKKPQRRCNLATYEQFRENNQVWKKQDSTGKTELVFNVDKTNKVMLFEISRQHRGGQNVPVDHCINSRHQYLPNQLDTSLPPYEIVIVKPIVGSTPKK